MGENNGSSNDSITTSPARANGAVILDLTSWPTVADVARRFGVTKQTVRNWQKMGRLVPVADAQNVTHYQPEEVNALAEARSLAAELERGLADDDEASASLLSPREKKAMGLDLQAYLVTPRLKLDDYMFRILGVLTSRLEFLETQHTAHVKAASAAEDNSAERKLVTETIIEETKLKGQLATKALETLSSVPRLLAAKKNGTPAGTPFLLSLSEEQLADMLLGDKGYSKAQKHAILDALEQVQAAQRAKDAASAPDAPVTSGGRVVVDAQGTEAPATSSATAAETPATTPTTETQPTQQQE